MNSVKMSSRGYVLFFINFAAHLIALYLAIEVYTVWVPHYIGFIKGSPLNLPLATLWLNATSAFILHYWIVIALGISLADGAACWLLMRRSDSVLLWQWSALVIFTYMIVFACTSIVFCLPVLIPQQ